MNWVDDLSGEERRDWDSFVEHFRLDSLRKIADSDMFVAIANENEIDPKFCMELGAAIMLDKPLVIVVPPDRVVPLRLQRIASHVIHADIDTEEGRQSVAEVLATITKHGV